MNKRRVFVSGPLGAENDWDFNVANAVAAGSDLMHRGFEVYVPHLNIYLHKHTARTYEQWMDTAFYNLRGCVALLRLQGRSPGADREVTYASRHGIAVFFDVHTLAEHFYDR